MEHLTEIIINGKTYSISGKDAYEISVDEGFEGTKEEWLNSLKGKTPQKGIDYFTAEDVEEIVEAVNISTKAKIGYVTLLADNWVGADSPYTQVVTVEGLTKNSQVDLTPSDAQLAIFHEKDLAFVTKNYKGVVTVSAIGQKPQNDYEMQVTITEVENTDEKNPIIGVTVGTPMNPSKITENFEVLIPQQSYEEEGVNMFKIEVGKKYKFVSATIGNRHNDGTYHFPIELYLKGLNSRTDKMVKMFILASPENYDTSSTEFTFKLIGFSILDNKLTVKYEYYGRTNVSTLDIADIYGAEVTEVYGAFAEWDEDLFAYENTIDPNYIASLVPNYMPRAEDWVL